MEANWIHVLSDAAVVGMVGYGISILKEFLQKVSESNDHAHDRIDRHDRVVSEIHRVPFDSSSIVKGDSHFPIFHKPKRES